MSSLLKRKTETVTAERPAVVKATATKDDVMKTKSFGENRNIVEQYAKTSRQDVFLEVPETGFMLKKEDNSYDAVIRFNFQTLSKSFKQTGFGSYYLDSAKFLGLITLMLNGQLKEREKAYRASKEAFPKPIFEDEKPSKNGTYKYFAIIPGMKEGKMVVRYIERDEKTKKQIHNIQIPFEEDMFYGKMMKIYTLMK